jgi:hypothetical protein
MNELMVTLGGLIASLGNAQSASVLREHVALLKTQFELVKDRLIALEEENASLIKRNAELEGQLARQEAQKEFAEARGALFKKLPGGRYDHTPYCPACHSAMWAFEQMFPFECGNPACKRIAGFKGGDLTEVLKTLP